MRRATSSERRAAGALTSEQRDAMRCDVTRDQAIKSVKM
jgi:hypothetical protein